MKKQIAIISVILVLIVVVVAGITFGRNDRHESPDNSIVIDNPKMSHTVTFQNKDGETITTVSVPDGENVYPPQPPAYEGFVFLRWDKSLTNVRSDRAIRAMYQELTTPTFSAENIFVNADENTVQMRISIHNNPGIASFILNAEFDSTLELTDVQFNSAWGEYITAPTPLSNPQSISFISPFEDYTYSGEIAVLTFKIADSEKSIDDYRMAVHLTYDEDNTFNSEYEDVPLSVLDGSITQIK